MLWSILLYLIIILVFLLIPISLSLYRRSGVTDHGALAGLGDNDHTQYFLIAGETGQIVIAPSALRNPLMDFQLEDEIDRGTIINMDYASATTLGGAITGIILDLQTNVTHNSQNTTGMIIRMPASDQSGTKGAISVHTLIDASKMGIEVIHTGSHTSGSTASLFFAGMTNMTVDGANSQTAGFRCDMTTITDTLADEIYGLVVDAPAAWNVSTASAICGRLGGIGNASANIINANGELLDFDMRIYPTGTIINMDYSVAETLTGALTGLDIDLRTNITQNSQTTTGLRTMLPASWDYSLNLHIGTGTNVAGYYITEFMERQTPDANPVALGTITLDVGTIYYIRAMVIGGEQGAGQRNSYEMSCLAYRSAGGAVLQGQTAISTIESDGAWDCVFNANGNTIEVQVTGDVINPVDWSGIIEYIKQIET